MTRKAKAHWIASGEVRGDCPHRHRSQSAAHACAARDHRAVQRGHGAQAYSDRRAVRVGDDNDEGE